MRYKNFDWMWSCDENIVREMWDKFSNKIEASGGGMDLKTLQYRYGIALEMFERSPLVWRHVSDTAPYCNPVAGLDPFFVDGLFDFEINQDGWYKYKKGLVYRALDWSHVCNSDSVEEFDRKFKRNKRYSLNTLKQEYGIGNGMFRLTPKEIKDETEKRCSGRNP